MKENGGICLGEKKGYRYGTSDVNKRAIQGGQDGQK